MKNVSQFKKRLVVGQKLHGIRFGQWGRILERNLPDTDIGIRPITVVQSNSFSLETMVDGEKTSAWCEIPKASQCEFPDENTIIIYWGEGKNRSKILQYTFVD